jgi:hypothetical protein
MFDHITNKKLGFYVYALIDPRNEQPFYIGKGKNNRVYEHVQLAIKNEAMINYNEKVLSWDDKISHIEVLTTKTTSITSTPPS